MLTREETIKAFEHCYIAHSCKGCPLEEQGECHTVEPGVNRAVMHYLKENKPTPVATDTNSEVSKDTNPAHIDDSKLLDICQEELEKISEIALGDFPNTYLTEYVEYIKNIIKKLRDGDSNV